VSSASGRRGRWTTAVSDESIGDAAAVSRLFRSLYEAVCINRDSEAAAALWSTDADVAMYGSEGEAALGPAAVRELLTTVSESPRTIEFTWSDHAIHLEGDVAWLTAFGSVVVDGRRSEYRTTAIFVRRQAAWKWHTHSGMEP
jgi:ketosteroid isomerase-like protein